MSKELGINASQQLQEYQFNLDLEDFRKKINSFSRYIVSTNQNFLYNMTYLEQFVEGFGEFQKTLSNKVDKFEYMFGKLYKVLSECDIEDFKIQIDGMWITKNNKNISETFDIKKISSQEFEVEVECIINQDKRKYRYVKLIDLKGIDKKFDCLVSEVTTDIKFIKEVGSIE